jgi:uncharacterized protein YbjT (DUF2867 family)
MPDTKTMLKEPILVTGSTGYVGGRLVPRLLQSGYRVRVMGRSKSKLACRPWASHARIELAEADMMDFQSVKEAVQGCAAAYYLVHSMNPRQKDFAAADRKAARNMAIAASAEGLHRIIYLGGLGAKDSALSEHLRSRTEVAEILKSGSVPVTFLRAAMILGAGSASFEMLRYLVERLPVMVTPRWVNTPCQPIAIRNVIHYLEGCLQHEATTGETFDIGGPDVLTYRQLIEMYTEEAHLPKRRIITVPVLTPRLSSYWVHLVTPLPGSIARPLIEGLSVPVVCQENRIQSIISQDLLPCREAIRISLERIEQEQVETCWSDAGHTLLPEWVACGDAPYAGGTILECGYRVVLNSEPTEVWEAIEKIGGRTGWYFADFLWALRGAMDRLMGGIGLRRGRRHPKEIRDGDALDFWRVLEVDAPRRLHLMAEMKTPGEAILDFRIHDLGNGRTELQQLSRFLPRGLFGILYWYALYPFHQWVFGGMLRGIARIIKKPIIEGPNRFAPRLEHVCYFNPKN